MYAIWLSLTALYLIQAYKAWEVNREVVTGQKHYAPQERYPISQVFVLELAYAVSFGSELAVVSMLPEFFEHTFNLNHAIAGPIAASYPLMNLVSRPAGGLISDKIGSRKWTLTVMTGGVGLGYLIMSQIAANWHLAIVIIVTMLCAFFVCAAAGATFGIASLIKPEATGQIAGNIGAYGSVGSVIYATLYSFLPQTVAGNRSFFEVLGIAAVVVCFLCVFILKEPKVIESKDLAEKAILVGH
jgi:NNP family nitrate/nitrite transporter-like MFS transporter